MFNVLFGTGISFVMGLLVLLLSVTYFNSTYGEPATTNAKFIVEKIFSGKFEPSTMTFLGPDDILVLDRNEGKVYRITDGVQSKPLLDVKVATAGYRGLLGVAVSKDDTTKNIFLYFTEARRDDGDDSNNNPVNPLGNRVYKYDLVDNKLVNPKLLLDLPAMPGPRHAGGVLAIGPDNNLYLTIGDLDGTFRFNEYETVAQNYQTGKPVDGRSGILVVSPDGKPTGKQILGESFPLNLYYAYGIRNSFGIDWDPLSGHLWDSENGPNFGDELNLVEPGFNSGWASVHGFWKSNVEDRGPLELKPDNLVSFDGHGKYSPPEFAWLNPVAPSAIKFLDSQKYGPEYENDLLVGDANYGNIYDFNLNERRTGFNLSNELSDRIADGVEDTEDMIFAKGFGKIADIDTGPEGLLYVLSYQKHLTSIYRISPR